MARYVTGYHGTTLAGAQQILRDGFKLSQGKWEWLGTGVYFWEDAPVRARHWASSWNRRWGRAGPVCVLAAEIELEYCLSLLDLAWDDKLREATTMFRQLLENRPGKKFTNWPDGRHELDCTFFNFLIDFLRDRGERVDVLRVPVSEGDPILEGSPVRWLSHVQLAVRNPERIHNVRIQEAT